MLTYYQVQTGAYVSEDFELFCSECFHSGVGDLFCRPLSNYELDEMQNSSYRDWCATAGFSEEWSDDWQCQGCEGSLECQGCGGELREEYDAGCAAANIREAEDDAVPNPD